MKSKIILTALALMFLLCLSSVASAWQMTTIGVGHNPAVYNSMVAWSDDTSGYGGIIHVYDLSAKKDTTINSSSASYPAIYGNKVVWHDDSSGTPMLTVYDLNSKSKSYITQDVDSNSIPVICGNIIAWSANDVVYMRDISKSTQTIIGTGINPDIDGTKIVYTNDSGSSFMSGMFGTGFGTGSMINVYDTSSKKTVECGSGAVARIYGNKVIWTNSDMSSGQSNLVMYDLSTKKMKNITTSSIDQFGMNSGSAGVGSYDIYGDNIVYVNDSSSSDTSGIGNIGNGIGNIGNGIGNIGSTGSTGGIPCIYSISKGKVTEIPEATQSGNIAVSSNAIVWDTPASGNNITVYQLASSSSSTSKVTKPVAAFKADKVSGKHPLAVTFTYTGTGGAPDSYTWNFGDNTKAVTTTAKTIKHTFAKAGTYTISVSAKNKAGSNTATKSKYITVK
jgi:beta propeller repeat protein